MRYKMDWNKRWKKQMVLSFHHTGGRDAHGLVERKVGGECSKHRQDGVHLQDLPKGQNGRNFPAEGSEVGLEERIREMRTVNRGGGM